MIQPDNDPIADATTGQLIRFMIAMLGGDMQATLNAPPPPKHIANYIQQADLVQLRRLVLDVTAKLDTLLHPETDEQ